MELHHYTVSVEVHGTGHREAVIIQCLKQNNKSEVILLAGLLIVPHQCFYQQQFAPRDYSTAHMYTLFK